MASAADLRHVRPITPLLFPDRAEDAHLRQSQRHAHLCGALQEMLRVAVPAAKSTVGAHKLVHWVANDPQRFLVPDAFVKLGLPTQELTSYRTWERGAPDLAFEILSPSDNAESWTLDEKIERYHELGVRELVVFDVDERAGHRLRVWDRVEDDFVERVVDDERTPCLTLGLQLLVGPAGVDPTTELPACVRLVRESKTGEELIPTLEETRRVDGAKEGLRLEAEKVQQAEADASRAAAQSKRAEAQARGDARAAELEAEAARARGGR